VLNFIGASALLVLTAILVLAPIVGSVRASARAERDRAQAFADAKRAKATEAEKVRLTLLAAETERQRAKLAEQLAHHRDDLERASTEAGLDEHDRQNSAGHDAGAHVHCALNDPLCLP
jgi:hypothetical protein